MVFSYSAVKDGLTTDLFADLITLDTTVNGDATDGEFSFENLDSANHITHAGTYVITVTGSAGTTVLADLSL